MKEDIIAINPVTENQISAIDEEKLPQIFAEQVRFLEKAKQKIEEAEKNKEVAENNVKDAVEEAEKFIDAAGELGTNSAEKKKFLWTEWTSKKDEIDALKKNLAEIIQHSVDSAEAQKRLVDVQSSLMASQTSILEVQKAQMEYQRQIANATKFVFGLSAYNMATSQSVLIKLKAILSGASEEQLGELAQQQLFLALDQIRNQESLITRINENDNLIENLNLKIEKKQKEITKIRKLDEEQNRRITTNTQVLAEHGEILKAQQQKDEEFTKMFAEKHREDAEQDEKISANAQILVEHEVILKAQQQKDEEFTQKFAEQDREDAEHDKRISENANKINEHTHISINQEKFKRVRISNRVNGNNTHK